VSPGFRFQDFYFFLQSVERKWKDSALYDLPRIKTIKRRGRKQAYGINRLSLVKRAVHRHGWQEVTCTVYGNEVLL
jgi:hypothetical protein